MPSLDSKRYLTTSGLMLSVSLILLLNSGRTALSGEVKMEKVEAFGWKNNLLLSNGEAELLITLDVGPRVLVYKLVGKPNVFHEVADQLGKSGEEKWQPRGGHRLWVGPEDLTRTYAPDNAPVQFEPKGPNTALLTPPPDAPYGIQKQIEVTLEPVGSRVTLVHRLTNVGKEPTDLAAWTLTVMRPKGLAILPMPAGHPHPGPPENAKSAADFAPDRVLVLWPFTDLQDPRWHFGSRYITLKQDPLGGPTKLGVASRQGWAAYWNAGMLFVKRFDYLNEMNGQPAVYPDGGVNFETFTNQDMLEMETLSPLVRLAPGKSIEHVERWDLIGGVGAPVNEGIIDREVLPRILKK